MKWCKGKEILFLMPFSILFLVLACQKIPDIEEEKGVTLQSQAEDVSASMHISSDSINTSELLQVDLTVSYPESVKLVFPEIGETTDQWGGFRIFERRNQPDKLDEEGRIIATRSYTLEPDLPGETEISDFTIKAIRSDGSEVMLEIAAVSIEVVSVLALGDNDMRDISVNDGVAHRDRSTLWWWLMVSGILILIGATFVWKFFKKQKQAPEGKSVLEGFEKLHLAPADEVMNGIETAVCQVISEKYYLQIKKMDFDGLNVALDKENIEIPCWLESVVLYERLKYNVEPVSDKQAHQLYAKFAKLLEVQKKEMTS